MNSKEYIHLSLEDREKICRERVIHHYSKKTSKSLLEIIFKIIVVIFACVGLGVLAVYLGVNLHLTNTDGIIDSQTEDFWETAKTQSALKSDTVVISDVFFNAGNYCAMKRIKNDYPGTFWRILDLALNDKKELAQNNLNVIIKNLNTISGNKNFCNDTLKVDVSKNDFKILAGMVDDTNKTPFLFASSTEWGFFKNGVVKDIDIIKKVEKETGIKSRILVSQLLAEQLRLFYSDRAWFEKMISPAKVLASMTKFSWGVLGIKEDTAAAVETNLKNKNSVFYPGPEYENMLNFNTTGISQERFKRITNYRDHYYGYLYAALFNKEVIAQWQKSGVDISNNPGVLATLYNIGFVHSVPKVDPQMGGAELNISGNRYSFGRLAYEFYYSGELLDEFPQ